MAPQRPSRRRSVSRRRHGSADHAGRRRLAREGLARQGRRRHLAQVHVRPARAAHARDPRRPDLCVFDRNGIWRLRDTNADGEADVHELFSNAFAQTADMREFPSSIRLAPGGDFVIAKGGQEATTIGKHNGSVLRISADGRTATVLGYGFRQPNLAREHPSRPHHVQRSAGPLHPQHALHIVRDRQFYGFLSDKLPREVYPAAIAEPLTWIPHAVNASAMSQVWLFDAKMGPLNDGMVHRLQRPRAVSRDAQHARTAAAGRRRQHHPRVPLSAAQRIGESCRRPALRRRLPGARVG